MDEKTIGGFEKWKVESAANTLIEAVKIRRKPKFYKVVLRQVRQIAKDAIKAAKEKQDAADSLTGEK